MSDSSVTVDITGQPYDVLIEPGLMSRCGALLRERSSAEKIALITDSNVAARYGLIVSASLARAEFEVVDLSIPAGERSKNWSTAGEVIEAVADHGLGRNDLVLALGGGVIGDLAGFVAATYLRGVAFAQMPTTLLAMVDSSVGGKTGVDLNAGKNLAGAFKQPILVLADTSALDSLPDEEWTSGLAEVAKNGLIDSDEHTSWIEENVAALVARDRDIVSEAVRRSVSFKARVVSEDERESGLRECLNYGHTLGHAIENVAGYGTYSHGVAVAEGMRFASRLSMDVAGADAGFVKRQDRLLNALGLLPIPDALNPSAVHEAMRSDKKARSGTVRFVLADGPGSWRCEPISDVVLSAHVNAWAGTKVKPEPEGTPGVGEDPGAHESAETEGQSDA